MGVLEPCAGITTTWDGISAWDNGAPGITDNAILNGNYDTGTNGSFSACSLVVNSGTLTIENNTFVEVQNDLTAIGNITVQPQGSFIQNNDLSSVSGSGTIQVFKETAPMSAWYEYTYWSSPVQNETFDALIETNPARRYVFNDQNFLDATQETNNNNAALPGQDDIDDNGDDWSWVSGTTVMQPGVGYGATLTEFAYNIAPGGASKQITLAPFVGLFNNGVYDVPIYRNDSELNDNNWNMIGNPYPSAIDVDLFLAANTNIETNTVTNPARAIDGAIYLWSQDTPPSPIANGNQGSNFSDSDFAIINGTTAIAGGDNIVPNRFIPSGQAFFVNMSNSAPATLVSGDVFTTDVTFSNSMRVANTSANSQFFKNSSSKNNAVPNKLWVNLTSDQGAFNQTAIAYVAGATDNDDGAYFDAPRPSAVVTASILYSQIEGSDTKFAIQGKSASSINMAEVISLGFKTNTDASTLLTLSIDHLQGDFLSTNTIYLKDNLLNKVHNLTDADYTFTSEVGEFNQRFEIVFNANALSVNDITADANSLKIVDLADDQVQFSTSNGLSIKNVKIYDLLGRQLYNLNGNRSVEVYSLSNLSNTVYIAKVELSNGALVTKKAIKK
jgi:hypothetical protein